MSSSAHAPTWAPRHPVFRSRGLASTASSSHTASSVGGGRAAARTVSSMVRNPYCSAPDHGSEHQPEHENVPQLAAGPIPTGAPAGEGPLCGFQRSSADDDGRKRGGADRPDFGERVRASAVAGYFAGWRERSSSRVIWPCRHLPAATRPRCRRIRPELVTHRTGRPARRVTGYDKRCIS